MRGDLLHVLKSLLKASNIKIDNEELKIQFLTHPSYPSLHALTGVLNHFNITNAAVRLPLKEDVLDELPTFFIAQIKSEDSDDLGLVKKNAESYQIIYTENNKVSYTKNEFFEKFLGIVVVVENENTHIKPSRSFNYRDYVLIPIVLTILLMQFLFYKSSIAAFIYLILSILGLIISYTIFKQELGESTIVGNAFCKASDENKDCNSVLNSKGAKILKNLKLSDICILYFSTTTILTYVFQITNTSYSLLYLISFLALPVTIYSVYYQKFIIKKWCALCLTIATILWLQASTAFIYNDLEISITIINVFVVLTLYSLTYIIWNYISKLIKANNELYNLRLEFLKFKKNFDLFKSALSSSETLDTNIPTTYDIKFGNINSNLKITIVTNPFCSHCKAVHTLIEDILKKYSESVEITIRFNVSTDQKQTQAVSITSRIIELFNTVGQDKCLQAMHDIYGDLKPDVWIEKWGQCNDFNKFYSALQENRDWCISKALNFTPVILINGKEYPKEYNRTDLIYFIEELNESLVETVELETVI
ncbi:vitamin K epoxide reductase family protein [Winogradskyella luteola]|uniref:Thioredoxin domain-containing protein n=1 Tax=Winogradskyella luteola TaxID=2828330 RepID=A0A9X1JS97_9FLAO|nr:vitamin K epoxide reductase family protein [Winogradskyella luteola]MBV7270713.1 thioredoxin domain-containing protein [Winogradskyella luteola]